MPDIASHPDESSPKKRLGVRNLNDAADVKRLVARLVRSALAEDGIDNATLRAVTGALQVFLKAHELADMEGRLAALEQRLAEAEGENYEERHYRPGAPPGRP